MPPRPLLATSSRVSRHLDILLRHLRVSLLPLVTYTMTLRIKFNFEKFQLPKFGPRIRRIAIFYPFARKEINHLTARRTRKNIPYYPEYAELTVSLINAAATRVMYHIRRRLYLLKTNYNTDLYVRVQYHREIISHSEQYTSKKNRPSGVRMCIHIRNNIIFLTLKNLFILFIFHDNSMYTFKTSTNAPSSPILVFFLE